MQCMQELTIHRRRRAWGKLIMDKTRLMQRAIELSRSSLERPGTRPYAAVVVRNGEIVGEGLNHADANFDPTSHGEIEAIRDACRNLKTTDLAGCELYTSCEPCILCVATMYRAGIEKLYFAASRDQHMALMAREEQSFGQAVGTAFDSDEVARQAIKPPLRRSMPAEQMMADDALAALDAWWVHQRGGSAGKF